MHARVWLLGNVIALGAIAAAPARGFAQPATVQAQSLFDEGRRLMAAGKLAEACAAFEASQQLDPAVTTLLNLAACRERNRQLATAWGTFVEANRTARSAGDDKLAKVATSHARKLEPRLSRLTIAVPPDRQLPGLAVLRGDDPVDPASWNHALPIDGGRTTITARAPGHTPWSTTRTIKAERDAQTIEVPRLAELGLGASPAVAAHGAGPPAPPAGHPAPVTPPPALAGRSAAVAPPPAPAGPPAPAASPPPRGGPPPVVASRVPSSATPTEGPGGAAPLRATQPADLAAAEHPASPPPAARGGEPSSTEGTLRDGSGVWPRYALPIALGAGAVALGGAALGFERSGDRLYDDAVAARQNGAPDAIAEDLRDRANTRRYLAEGLGVAAVGCAGAAVYLYVRGRGEPRPPAAAVAPIVSPDLAGLAVAGRW